MSIEITPGQNARAICNTRSTRSTNNIEVVKNAEVTVEAYFGGREFMARLQDETGIFYVTDFEPVDAPTPAPLDPAKVKAGETVTLERDTALARDVVERIDPYPQGGFSIVLRETTPAYLTVTGWTLTDHQPAPEPEPAFQFGTALVDGVSVRGFLANEGESFVFPFPDGGYHEVGVGGFDDFAPDELRPLPTLEQVEVAAYRASLDGVLVSDSTWKVDGAAIHRHLTAVVEADAASALLRGESR